MLLVGGCVYSVNYCLHRHILNKQVFSLRIIDLCKERGNSKSICNCSGEGADEIQG